MHVLHRFPGQRLSPWVHREGVLWHQPSQSTTTAASPTREQRREGGRAGGLTEPFRGLGFARYVSHEGERPMAIRWLLERPIPARWMQGMELAV